MELSEGARLVEPGQKLASFIYQEDWWLALSQQSFSWLVSFAITIIIIYGLSYLNINFLHPQLADLVKWPQTILHQPSDDLVIQLNQFGDHLECLVHYKPSNFEISSCHQKFWTPYNHWVPSISVNKPEVTQRKFWSRVNQDSISLSPLTDSCLVQKQVILPMPYVHRLKGGWSPGKVFLTRLFSHCRLDFLLGVILAEAGRVLSMRLENILITAFIHHRRFIHQLCQNILNHNIHSVKSQIELTQLSCGGAKMMAGTKVKARNTLEVSWKQVHGCIGIKHIFFLWLFSV